MAAPEAAVPVTAENTGRNSRGQFEKNNVYTFPKGASPNPGGRPRKQPLTAALEADLELQVPSTAEMRAACERLSLKWRPTFAQLIARSMMMKAITDASVAAEVCDRVEGKAVARTEFSGVDGKDIRITVTYEDAELKP
jgi:hypothetical protein